MLYDVYSTDSLPAPNRRKYSDPKNGRDGTKRQPKRTARRNNYGYGGEFQDRHCPYQEYYGLLICIVLFVALPFILWMFFKSDSSFEFDGVAKDKSALPDMLKISMWGHKGEGVTVNPYVLTEVHRIDYASDYFRYGYNKFVSDRISSRRQLPDFRHIRCQGQSVVTSSLPKASVVILFRDEARSVLFRAVYSVLERTPRELLKEIILVNYGAMYSEGLHQPVLENYLSSFQKVKVHRLGVNHTLTTARAEAARLATGTVLVLLSPRCEVTSGWLEPLVVKVQEGTDAESVVIATPVLDTIHYDTFEYQRGSENLTSIYTWDWYLTTHRTLVQTPSDLKSIATPTLGQMIFAVNRKSFLQNGGFSNDVTNGSVLEFSLRCWLCGCRIDTVPCSRVGVVSRSLSYKHQLSDDDRFWLTILERLTLARDWMAGWDDFVTERLKSLSEIQKQLQNLTPPKNERAHLHCKDFGWYLGNLRPDLWAKDESILYRGLIQSIVFNTTVLHLDLKGTKISLVEWYKSSKTFWYMTETGYLKTEHNFCLGHSGNSSYSLTVKRCPDKSKNSSQDVSRFLWSVQKNKGHNQIIHKDSRLCLTWQRKYSTKQNSTDSAWNSRAWPVLLRNCKSGLRSQLWQFRKLDGSRDTHQMPSNELQLPGNKQQLSSKDLQFPGNKQNVPFNNMIFQMRHIDDYVNNKPQVPHDFVQSKNIIRSKENNILKVIKVGDG